MTLICKIIGHKFNGAYEVGPLSIKYRATSVCTRCGLRREDCGYLPLKSAVAEGENNGQAN